MPAGRACRGRLFDVSLFREFIRPSDRFASRHDTRRMRDAALHYFRNDDTRLQKIHGMIFVS